jgi:hypothetical protein
MPAEQLAGRGEERRVQRRQIVLGRGAKLHDRDDSSVQAVLNQQRDRYAEGDPPDERDEPERRH